VGERVSLVMIAVRIVAVAKTQKIIFAAIFAKARVAGMPVVGIVMQTGSTRRRRNERLARKGLSHKR
jgi:hypothetical protein